MPAIATSRKIITNADKPKISDEDRKAREEKIAALKSDDMRLVTGIFKNLECPGGSLRFCQKKYKGEPVNEYIFWDGKEYTVPLYVAKYLNNNCAYPIHKQTLDANGLPIDTVGKMINRFAFISTDFR